MVAWRGMALQSQCISFRRSWQALRCLINFLCHSSLLQCGALLLSKRRANSPSSHLSSLCAIYSPLMIAPLLPPSLRSRRAPLLHFNLNRQERSRRFSHTILARSQLSGCRRQEGHLLWPRPTQVCYLVVRLIARLTCAIRLDAELPRWWWTACWISSPPRQVRWDR